MASGTTTRRSWLALAAAGTVLAGCSGGAPKRDAAGAIEQGGDTGLLNLHAGDCVANLRERLESPDGGHNGVPEVTAVNCSAEHDAEVLRIAPLGGGGWPGFAIVDGEAARGRNDLQSRLVRIKRAAGPLTIVSFRPTKPRWDFEDQHEIVFVALFDKPRRGPAPT
jgi:hypothetical protein